MNFFKLIAEILAGEMTATITIRKNGNGKLFVSTSFTTNKGAVCDGLTPFTLKGTPEELDDGYADAIRKPAEEVSGLINNWEQFEEAKRKAQEELKAKNSTGNSAAVTAEENARKEKERKEKYATATAAADKAMQEFKFHTAAALLTLADTLTTDRKEKAELAKKLATANNGKDGLMCEDSEEEGKAAAEEIFVRKTETASDNGDTAENTTEENE